MTATALKIRRSVARLQDAPALQPGVSPDAGPGASDLSAVEKVIGKMVADAPSDTAAIRRVLAASLLLEAGESPEDAIREIATRLDEIDGGGAAQMRAKLAAMDPAGARFAGHHWVNKPLKSGAPGFWRKNPGRRATSAQKQAAANSPTAQAISEALTTAAAPAMPPGPGGPEQRIPASEAVSGGRSFIEKSSSAEEVRGYIEANRAKLQEKQGLFQRLTGMNRTRAAYAAFGAVLLAGGTAAAIAGLPGITQVAAAALTAGVGSVVVLDAVSLSNEDVSAMAAELKNILLTPARIAGVTGPPPGAVGQRALPVAEPVPPSAARARLRVRGPAGEKFAGHHWVTSFTRAGGVEVKGHWRRNPGRRASVEQKRKAGKTMTAGRIREKIKAAPKAKGPAKPPTTPKAPAPKAPAAKDEAARMEAAKKAEAEKPESHWGSPEQPYWRPGPNPTVDNVITRDNPETGATELLLIKRAENATEGGKWALPGGFHDSAGKKAKGEFWKAGKESARDAALRELAEETGLDASAIGNRMKEVGKFSDFGRDPRDNDEAWAVTTSFRLHLPKELAKQSEAVKGLDDASDARWWPISEAAALGLAFDHNRILDESGASK